MNILYVEPIINDLSVLFAVLITMLLSFITIVSISIYDRGFSDLKGLLLIVCATCVIAFALCLAFKSKVNTGRNRYEVIFEDGRDTKDIYDEYTVVGQRGKIWILEDKEVNEE